MNIVNCLKDKPRSQNYSGYGLNAAQENAKRKPSTEVTKTSCLYSKINFLQYGKRTFVY